MIRETYAQLIANASLVIVEKSRLSICDGIANSVISRLGVSIKFSNVSILDIIYPPLEIGRIESCLSDSKHSI